MHGQAGASNSGLASSQPSRLLRSLAMATALVASALAGAWIQSYAHTPAHAADAFQAQAMDARLVRDSAHMRDTLALLAGKVGELQARLITMTALSRRIAKQADIAYTDPEINAGIDTAAPPMDDIAGARPQPDSGVSLGLALDRLQQRMTEQGERLALLDLAFTRRAGIEARLPDLTPVDYTRLSSPFGWRVNPVTHRRSLHEGMDLVAPRGAAIYAASGGVVTKAGREAGYGNMVEIDHGNGLVTRYAHASALDVKVGDLVEKGQVIAQVGTSGRSTGPHLHFEVRMAGTPLDPRLFLAKPGVSGHLVAAAATHAGAGATEVR
ncbi:peptidase M23 [Candidimonas nitroreducens]|uniref:Peptidase M23 n=1 Tax=Candidimonas nitroreducens TaxID=683354 RepID=A0A225MGF6_9BURK|nr:peptidase M23 [Candidimonas nitroreducens]